MTDVRRYLIRVLIFISLMLSNVGHLCKYLVSTCMSFFFFFFLKLSIEFICPLFCQVVCSFDVELNEQFIHRFNAISIITYTNRLPRAFFTESVQKILQFVWKHKGPWIAKTILKKKNRAGGRRLADFRLH